MGTFVATDPEAYEAYVGRGSQRLAPAFVRFAGVSAKERVLDVGCGTGHLTRAIAAATGVATGIDLSAPYVEFARRITADPGIAFQVGDALDLPFPDGLFERTLSMLALDVLPATARHSRQLRDLLSLTPSEQVVQTSGPISTIEPTRVKRSQHATTLYTNIGGDPPPLHHHYRRPRS